MEPRLIIAALLVGYLTRQIWEEYMTARITIDAQPREKITVKLVDKEYVILPPKGSTGLALARRARAAKDDPEKGWEAILSWLKTAAGPKQATAIEKRLNDPEDLLDIIHISSLIEQVSELASGNPTTS